MLPPLPLSFHRFHLASTELPLLCPQPEQHLQDAELLQWVNALAPQDRWAFTELFVGTFSRHVLYASQQTNPVHTFASHKGPAPARVRPLDLKTAQPLDLKTAQ